MQSILGARGVVYLSQAFKGGNAYLLAKVNS